MKKTVLLFAFIIIIAVTVALLGGCTEGETGESLSSSQSISSSVESSSSSPSSSSSLTAEEEQALKDEMLGLIEDLKEGD